MESYARDFPLPTGASAARASTSSYIADGKWESYRYTGRLTKKMIEREAALASRKIFS